jgi:ribosomal protein RSM22 (predicted rRNA methylase)
MKCFNKKQAMLDAGYSPSYSATRSNDIFHNPEIAAEIQRRQNLASHRADVDLDWIVARLRQIADANLGEALDVYSDGSASINFNKLTPALKKALNKFSLVKNTTARGETVSSKVGFSDQLKALELLVRHLGLSKEKQTIELSGEVELIEQLHRGRARAGAGEQEEAD